MVMVSKALVESRGWHAGNAVRAIAKEINGGGGGQPFFASAGGAKPEGIAAALAQLKAQLS